MTLLAILAVAAFVSAVLTLGLLLRGARKAAPGRENCYATTRWHESGEAVE